MSCITKLSYHLGVNWLWNSDLGDSSGAYPGLVAAACVREVFCTPFVGIPTSLMTKTPLWVVSDPFYAYGLHFRSCVPVLNPLTVQLYKPHFRQQFVPDLFWCYTVLYVCALYARCNTFFFSSRKAALKHSLAFTALQDCSRFGSAQSFALGLLLHSNRHYSPKG